MPEQLDLDRLRQPFPHDAIKQRAGGGGRALSYVEGFTVIRRLNDACPAWDFAILREWQDGNLLKAHVRLTIPGLGSREHVGVQVVNDRPGTEDVQAKGHITDALKKAATLFGVGLELYGPDYEAGEIAAPQPRQQPQRAQTPPRQPAPASGPANAPQRPAPGPGLISEKQIRYLFGLAKDAGLSNEDLHAQMYARYRVAHVPELSKQQATDFIDKLKANDLIDGEAPPPDGRVDPVEQASRAGQAVMAGLPEEPAYLAGAPDPWTA